MKIHFVILFLVTLNFCEEFTFNNPNDPNSVDFLNTQLIECNTKGSALCPPFRVKGKISGLTANNTLRLQFLWGAPSDEITSNGQFDVLTRGGIYPNVFISKQPSSLHCFVTNTGIQSGKDVIGVEITCPLFKTFVNKKLVGISRCAYGQEWNTSGLGDCTGFGSAGTQYDISLYLNYCNITPTRGCQNDIPGGELSPPPWIGAASSDIYTACNQYNISKKFQISNWRVPTKEELKQIVYCDVGPTAPLADFSSCNVGHASPTVNASIFTNLATSNILWSSTSYILDDVQAFALVIFRSNIHPIPRQHKSSPLCHRFVMIQLPHSSLEFHWNVT